MRICTLLAVKPNLTPKMAHPLVSIPTQMDMHMMKTMSVSVDKLQLKEFNN